MGFTKETIAELKKPLSPSLPKTLKGNRYLEGHVVISQANRIFGFDGWGYDVINVQLERVENVDKDGAVTHQYGYSAMVRVEVDGAGARTDVGWNTVQKWKTGYTPDAHDTAMKGAVTDAMKRALRSFGHQFGNGLYGDGTYEQKIEGGQQSAPTQNGRPPQKQSSNGQAPPPDNVEFMPDGTQKADPKLIAEIQKMGPQVYGEAEWENGVSRSVAEWGSGDRERPVSAIEQLSQQEALKVSKGLRKRLEGGE